MKYCLLSYSFYLNQVGNFVAASRNSDFPGYLPSGSQGRKRDDLCSVFGRSRTFASPYLSSRFRSHVYFASSVSTQVLQFISVDFFQFFRSLLIQVFFFFRSWNITLDRRACAPSPAFLFYGYERFPLPKPFFQWLLFYCFFPSYSSAQLKNKEQHLLVANHDLLDVLQFGFKTLVPKYLFTAPAFVTLCLCLAHV